MFYILLLINAISFVLFWIDKRQAVRHRRRVSEFTLLSAAFLGGTIGTLLGMLMFRHKISKGSFLVKVTFIVLVQAALIYYDANIFNLIKILH